MAQKKKTTPSRSSSRSGRPVSKSSASSRPVKSSRALPPEPDKEPLWSVLWTYSWGKALYLLLGILVLIGLDFLIAMNHYDRFFTVLGIEIIVAMITGWIVFLFLDRRKQRNSNETDPDSIEED
ncbi:MAG: hypothetical protein IK020_01620 [Clostridiales bacterium]|nr:hypothetical protein [Clostridiales bacterium]